MKFEHYFFLLICLWSLSGVVCFLVCTYKDSKITFSEFIYSFIFGIPLGPFVIEMFRSKWFYFENNAQKHKKEKKHHSNMSYYCDDDFSNPKNNYNKSFNNYNG